MALLFNPATYNPRLVRRCHRRQLLALVDFFEAKGFGPQQRGVLLRGVVHRFFSTWSRRRRSSRPSPPRPKSAPRRGRRPLGSGPGSTSSTRSWASTAGALVRLAGLGAGLGGGSVPTTPRAEVARLLAGGSIFGSGSPSANTAPTSTPGHDPAPHRRQVHRQRRQVVHRHGNAAGRPSVYGKFADDDPDHPGEHVFTQGRPQPPGTNCSKNAVAGQMSRRGVQPASTIRWRPTTSHVGKPAFDAALAMVNVGKGQLGWASTVSANTLLRGRHPRTQPGPLRQSRHRLPARSSLLADAHARGWWP